MTAHIHDRGYKKLFSNHTFFQQLLEEFVKEEWVKGLDFSTCERIDKSFLSADYDQTTSDVIYKIKLRGQDVYVIILTEFQSTVDRFMVLRVLNYITNFYMDYVFSMRESEETERLFKLPAVFPIVLYNGEDRWTAPINIAELIETEPDLGEYKLDFKYFKIAENEFSQEDLFKIRNLVSTLFLAESHYDIDLLIEESLTIFTNETDKRAASLLLNWFKQIWVKGRITTDDYEKLDEVYHNVKEARTMMATAVAAHKEMIYKQGKAEGREEGIEEGIEKGRVEKGREEGIEKGREEGIEKGVVSAKQNTFVMILEHKFGEISDVIAEMITLVDDVDELDQWLNRALDAKTLGDLWEKESMQDEDEAG